jgi:hypothetical protein
MIGLPLSFSLLLMQTGCSRLHNERLTLGGSYHPPTIHADSFSTTKPAVAHSLFSESPIDRAAWDAITFVAPYDGTAHHLTMRVMPPLRKDDQPRIYGRYPSIEDSLDPQSHSWAKDGWSTLEELGRSTIGSVFAIGYLVWEGELGKPRTSPIPYKRARQDDWSSGLPATMPPNEMIEEQIDELD